MIACVIITTDHNSCGDASVCLDENRTKSYAVRARITFEYDAETHVLQIGKSVCDARPLVDSDRACAYVKCMRVRCLFVKMGNSAGGDRV